LDKQCFSFHLPPWQPTDSFEEAKFLTTNNWSRAIPLAARAEIRDAMVTSHPEVKADEAILCRSELMDMLISNCYIIIFVSAISFSTINSALCFQNSLRPSAP